MSLTVVSAPTQEPLSLDQVKDQCSIDRTDTTFDEMLTRFIREQREEAETFLNRALITRTLALGLSAWPTTKAELYLPMAPAQAGDFKVEYYNAQTNTLQEWSADNYELDLNGTDPAVLVPVYGKSFPAVFPRRKAIIITYKAGYGDTAESVPEPIKQAMLFKIGSQFMQREHLLVGTNQSEMDWAYKAKLSPHRIYPFGGIDYAP